jgi:hypothetical protein
MRIEKSIWKDIADGKVQAIKTLNYSIVKQDTIHDIGVFVGLGNESNRKAILIRAKLDLLPSKDFPDTKGLSLKTEMLDVESERYVVLELISDDYLDVFVSLCNDVFKSLGDSKNQEDLINRYYARVSAWKLFFAKTRDGILGMKGRIGLYAELSFIIEKLIPTYGPDFLPFWTGPDGKPHDFEMGNFGVEVKASSGKKGHKAHISNEKQLDDDGLDNLYLFFNSISEKNNFPATIPEAIRNIKQVISKDDSALLEFEEKILAAGYNYMYEEKYNKYGYQIHETKVYEVKEGFPRIISENIPNGCGGIKYQIELSACVEFEVGIEELDSKINKKA